MTLDCKVTSRSGGYALSAQQAKSTAGLLRPQDALGGTSLAAQFVLAKLLADATPCRRCTLTQPQSGTTAKMKTSPAIFLPTAVTSLGGSALSVAAGNRPSIHKPDSTEDGKAETHTAEAESCKLARTI